MEQMNQWIDDHTMDVLQTLQRWISHPSLKAEAAEGAPFGLEIKKALDAALADGEALGFSVRNLDGYAGDIRMGPLGVNPLAILTHLDIVPIGDNWTVDPFEGAVHGDRVIGRGAVDDKGPGVAAMYAMKAVLEAGIPLKREVRLILGCDEEEGMGDIEYYKEHYDLPSEGFSPDAKYPVINTEKGLVALQLTADCATEGLPVLKIAVGERHNVIPGEASALVEGDEALASRVNTLAKDMALAVRAETVGLNQIKLTAKGIQGHASLPENARNAIGMLLLMLRALDVRGPLKTLADTIGLEYDGSGLGVACSDHTSGALTCNLGILRYDETGLYAEIDIRYPLLCSGPRIIQTIQTELGDAFHVDSRYKEAHHVSPNSKLVTALLDAYQTLTGRIGECVAIGGGTYARCLREGVAFGATFPEEEEVAHQADEYIKIDTLMQNVKIMARAIELLAGPESVE